MKIRGGVSPFVAPPPVPPVIDPLAEPVFSPGDTDLLASVGCDGTFMSAANWAIFAALGGTAVIQGAGSARDGVTKAIRLTWPAAVAEAFAGFDTAQWANVTRLITTFWFKTASIITDNPNNAGLKWVLFRRDPNAGDPFPHGRITWGLHSLAGLCDHVESGVSDGGIAFTTCDQFDGNGIIQNVSYAPGWSTPSHVRAMPVNDNTWHRCTNEANIGAKYMRCWLDGIRVLDSSGFTPTMPALGFRLIGWGQNNPHVIDATSIDFSNVQAFTR